MLDQIANPSLLHAQLNFAADRTNGGIWSNLIPSLITQALEGHNAEIRDARQLASPPALAREGFEYHHRPLGNYTWDDPLWVQQTYVPDAMALVQALTGAALVKPFYRGGVLHRDTANPNGPGAAEFVHLDQTRDSVQVFLEMAADAETRAKYPRTKIFNVWRVVTPPPQDVPLAVCDQRTLDKSDWVVGRTVEPNFPDGVPYLTSVYNPAQKWHYISNLTPDDAVVFKGYDSDPASRMGCLHGAFKRPELLGHAVPRASTELRVFAFFPE